jgi:hypothetical protein
MPRDYKDIIPNAALKGEKIARWQVTVHFVAKIIG